MKRQLILVVDYGTSNTRVNAIDTANGEIAYSAAKKYRINPKGKGYAEISADELWSFSVECMKSVMGQLGADDEPRAVAYSFFGDNLIPVDKEGNALNDCILCTDPRGAAEAEYVNAHIPREEQVRIIGDSYMLYKFGAKVLWVKNHMPELAEHIAYYDTQQQYIFRRLGLKPVCDYTMAARKQLLDLRTLKWSGRFLEVLGIPEESLGNEIAASGDIIGHVKKYGDVDLGRLLPVIVGGHDCDVGMIGMGLIREKLDMIGDITGTYDHVGYLADRVVNLQEENPQSPLCSYSGPFQGSSVCLGAFPTAGATLEWFMRDIHEGTKKEDYEKYWASVSFDGKGQVMVQPTLDGSRGVIEGIGVNTSKADIFKAVIEALTFENRRLTDNCRKVKKGGADRMRIGGGAANSDEWMQLRADISGMTVERMKNIQVSSVGSAVLAAAAVGIYPDVAGAVSHMVHVQDTFRPDPEVCKKYEEKYQKYLEKMNY